MMFSAWDYGHYSMLHAEEEASYCGRFAQLLETGSLGASTAGKLSAGNVCKEKAAHKVHFSSLSRQEHKLYLRLLSKYRERVITEPTPIQQQEIAQLADLQRRVVEEQKLFSLAFCQLPEARACYASIQPDALRFAREHASRRLERLLRLPRYFVAQQKVALECPPEDQVLPHFHRNLIMRVSEHAGGAVTSLSGDGINISLSAYCNSNLHVNIMGLKYPRLLYERATQCEGFKLSLV